MRYALYVIAAFQAFGALSTIMQIGKDRKTITPGAAAAGVAIGAVVIVVLILAAGQVPA